MVLWFCLSAPAMAGACDGNLDQSTFTASDPEAAVELRVRQRRPQARVVRSVARDAPDGWWVMVAVDLGLQITQESYHVIDNDDGTFSVRVVGARGR